MIEKARQAGEVARVGQESQHFTLLLVAFLLLFFTAPLSWLIEVHLFSAIGSLLMTSVLIVDILLAALFASSRRRDRTVALCFAVPSLATYVLCLFSGNEVTWVVAHALGIIFLAYVMTIVTRYVFTARRVTWNTVSAGLCLYLLFSAAYALFYSILVTLDPNSFSHSIAEGDVQTFGSEFSITALYYSLVTMTTLGYGDVIPTTPVTQMAASVQALVGQLYVAVLIARLVGLHVAESMSNDR